MTNLDDNIFVLKEKYKILISEKRELERIIEAMIYTGERADIEQRQEIDKLRDTLNKVYAERDNARDDAEAMRLMLNPRWKHHWRPECEFLGQHNDIDFWISPNGETILSQKLDDDDPNEEHHVYPQH